MVVIMVAGLIVRRIIITEAVITDMVDTIPDIIRVMVTTARDMVEVTVRVPAVATGLNMASALQQEPDQVIIFTGITGPV
jgi:hypothetical protein